MRLIQTLTHSLVAVTALVAITACQVDRIEPSQEELYTRQFIKEFGVPDANHTWAVAQRVSASVEASEFPAGSAVYVYTAMPGNPDSQLAAVFSTQTSNMEFDFPQSLDRAYVVVKQLNHVITASYLTLDNGSLKVNGGTNGMPIPTVIDISGNRSIGVVKDNSQNLKSDALWSTYISKYGDFFPKADPIGGDETASSGSGSGSGSQTYEDITITLTDTPKYYQYSWDAADSYQGKINDIRSETALLTAVVSYGDNTGSGSSSGTQGTGDSYFGLKLSWTDYVDSEGNISSTQEDKHKFKVPEASDGSKTTIKIPFSKDALSKAKTNIEILHGGNITIHSITVSSVGGNPPASAGTGSGSTATTTGITTFDDNEIRVTQAFRLYGLTHDNSSWDAYRFGTGQNGSEGSAQYVQGIQNDYSQAYNVKDFAEIVGKGGVFEENARGTAASGNSCNLKDKATLLNPKDGVVYVVDANGKDHGKVTVEYFFGCTANYNSVGYFYYTPKGGETEEEINAAMMRAPKFMLMYNASPGDNLQVSDTGNEGDFKNFGNKEAAMNNTSGGFKDTNNNSDGWMKITSLVRDDNVDSSPAKVLSTDYQLIYYPYDQETGEYNGAAGQETFPDNTRIGFFVLTDGFCYLNQNTAKDLKGDSNDPMTPLKGDRFGFSIPALNAMMYNNYASEHTHGHDSWNDGYTTSNTPDTPWSPFVTYKWGDRYVMALEDATIWGDHDMNDVLFFINGDVKAENEEKIVEVTKVNKLQSWLLVIEDLGTTDDYDFNDVVVGLSFVTTDGSASVPQELKDVETSLFVTPIAAGGTLPVYLKYDGKYITKSGMSDARAEEWHSYFGKGSNVMVNTSAPGKIAQTFEVKDFGIINLSQGTGTGKLQKFSLEVTNNGKTYEVQNGELTPQMIILPNTWKYPAERKHIRDDCYSGFGDWVENATNFDWINLTPTNVIDHGWKGHEITTTTTQPVQ